MRIRLPGAAPCGSCPYRRDVPSGVWDSAEYAKLPAFDRVTAEQPTSLFLCHQADGRLCAGWVGCHGAWNLLSVRLAAARGVLSMDELAGLVGWSTSVPLFGSGAEAAAHGVRDVGAPGAAARVVVGKLMRKRGV